MLSAPVTSFRLSAPECRLISRGFDVIRYYGADIKLEAHDPKLWVAINEVAKAVSQIARRPKGVSHRLNMDAVSIAMFQYAVRSFAREARRGDIPSIVWPAGINKQRLLVKLERHRKRAKRLWLRIGDAVEFADLSQRWRRFQAWARESHRPFRFPRPNLYHLYRRNLDWVFAHVKRVLAKELNDPLPEDRDLRRLTRRMVRHVRRERAPVTMRDLIMGTEEGCWFIASYLPRLIAIHHSDSCSVPVSREDLGHPMVVPSAL